MTSFTVGDVVRLKSGGPKMTISDSTLGDGLVCCEYFIGDQLAIYCGKPEMLALAHDEDGFYDIDDNPDYDGYPEVYASDLTDKELTEYLAGDDVYDDELETALHEYWMLHGHD